MKNSNLSSILLLSLSLSLIACGGGGAKDENNQINNVNTNTTPVSNIIQPRSIETENWQSARIIDPNNPIQNTVEIVGSQLEININSADLIQGNHLQIYINSDNKPETGFQFENQAWEESGVDFLIEDGDLFQSTQNNTGWNWNVNAGAIDYTIDVEGASAKIDLSLLGDICNNLKIGVMTRDEFWDISTFSPASSQMQTFTVPYCNTEILDTTDPVIGLLGANPINLNIGELFVDPGATAFDNIDGDITSSIATNSDLNTQIEGTYVISYSITDAAGNSSAIARQVIVSDSTSQEGIVIDGNINDWAEIPTLASSADATMKATDDEDKLYILLTSSNLGKNTQILIDIDKNESTGLDLSAQVNAWLGGADYMIENNSLDKSKSNTGWSWDYGIAPIEYIKTVDTLEIAIKKSDFNQLPNTISFGYVSRTNEWNANYVLPNDPLPSYNLKFPSELNSVNANNDSVTTLNEGVIEIDVLVNDTSTLNNILTVTQITQPESGSAILGDNNIIFFFPLFGSTGIETFTYQVSDTMGNSDTATVKVTVTAPPNLAPTAIDDSIDIYINRTVIFDLLLNDNDPNGDTLELISTTNPANGTIEIIDRSAIKYIPDINFSGIDTFNYTITDNNGGSDTATATVTVDPNVPPIATGDSATTSVGTAVTLDVLVNDTSNSGSNQLTITSVETSANGTASIFNGQIVYTPNSSFLGTDSFRYTILDSNGEEAIAIAYVTVTVETIKPEAKDDSKTTLQNTPVTIDVLNNDNTNSGSFQLTITNVDNPSNGFVTIVSGQIIYTPNAGFIGTDTFTYIITDSNGETDTATVTMTVQSQNPVAQNDSATTLEETPVTIDVLGNDTSNSGSGQLAITSVGNSSNGNTQIIAGQIRYTPNFGFIGIDIFDYTITDSNGNTVSGTVNVSVLPINNNPPVAVDDYVTTDGIRTLRIRIRDNDFDPDNNGTELTNDYTQPSNGTVARNTPSTLDYTPNSTFTGTDSFTYTIKDRRGATAKATVFVTVLNNAPNAVDDFSNKFSNQIITINVLSNDIDIDGDILSVQSIIQPSIGLATLNSNGTITFDPQNNVGSFNIIYNISDGRGGIDSAVLTISATDPR